MLKIIGPILSLIFSAATAAGQLTPDVTTRYDQGMSAKTDQNDIVITARRTIVNVTHPSWHSGKGGLVVLYDSSTGYFLWGLGPVPKTQQNAGTMDGYGTLQRAYVAADRFVQFTFAYPDLLVKESLGRANSLDDAESKSLQAAIPRLPTLLAWNQPDRVIIDIGKLLPHDFAATPPQVHWGPFKLVNVSHKGNTWEVTVEGQWQEKITLNEKYQVTGIARAN